MRAYVAALEQELHSTRTATVEEERHRLELEAALKQQDREQLDLLLRLQNEHQRATQRALAEQREELSTRLLELSSQVAAQASLSASLRPIDHWREHFSPAASRRGARLGVSKPPGDCKSPPSSPLEDKPPTLGGVLCGNGQVEVQTGGDSDAEVDSNTEVREESHQQCTVN